MRFAGYAARFDLRDSGGDIIRPGAFSDIATPLPLLWQHDGARPIGTVDVAREDARGLWVEGALTDGDATAAAVARMLGEGAVDGLSFGYRVRAAENGAPGRGGAATRDLLSLDLIEISIVTNPMQPLARVAAIF
ncbi:MAG: HK97 family phage prohead protease [Sphingomonadaceae bacterium]|nr:HK97 family phage prohead protease [Sphingomonadaceae bacterium]